MLDDGHAGIGTSSDTITALGGAELGSYLSSLCAWTALFIVLTLLAAPLVLLNLAGHAVAPEARDVAWLARTSLANVGLGHAVPALQPPPSGAFNATSAATATATDGYVATPSNLALLGGLFHLSRCERGCGRCCLPSLAGH